MRRYTTIATVMLGLSLAAVPVAHAEGYGGFRAGVNNASFTGDGSESFPDSRMGFTGGISLGVDGGGHLGFRTDLLYTMKGGKNGDASVKIDYFEMAPLLVGRYSLSQRYGLRAFLGPVFGVFANAEGDNGPVDIDFGDIVEHAEVSGTIGAEFNAKAGPYILLLEARYTRGSRVFRGEDLEGEPLNLDVSNTGLAVMAGMMVPF